MTFRLSTAAPILALAVVLVFGCSSPTSSSHSIPTYQPAEVLAALPVNSDRRCVGIAIVIEAMLGASSVEGGACLPAPTLADQLYANAATTGRIKLPELIEAGGAQMPLLSAAALEILSTLIADRHKQDFERWTSDEATAGRLAQAQMNFVGSTEELRQVFLSDLAQVVAFGGPGIRQFPDGEQRETHHAFVLQLRPDGSFIVHDPNDPRSPVPCTLEETEDGLLIEWTCQYRETELMTTQGYYLVPMRKYLASAFRL